MEYKNLLIETFDNITKLKVNREKALNALNPETIEELEMFLDQLQESKETKVLIITGAGEKSFIAGADITSFVNKNPITIRPFVLKLQSTLNKLEDLPIPVIAQINGYCLGGGLELALACDLRIASEKALLGQPEIKLGIIPGAGGTQRLSRIVGKGIAKEIIFLGENISAQRAYELGIVNRVVSAEELNQFVLKIAKKITEGPSFALNMAKEAINRGPEMSLLDGIRLELDLFTLCFSHEDMNEGVDAFLNKRKANFK